MAVLNSELETNQKIYFFVLIKRYCVVCTASNLLIRKCNSRNLSSNPIVLQHRNHCSCKTKQCVPHRQPGPRVSRSFHDSPTQRRSPNSKAQTWWRHPNRRWRSPTMETLRQLLPLESFTIRPKLLLSRCGSVRNPHYSSECRRPITSWPQKSAAAEKLRRLRRLLMNLHDVLRRKRPRRKAISKFPTKFSATKFQAQTTNVIVQHLHPYLRDHQVATGPLRLQLPKLIHLL